ncbi:SirB1 family protein [Sphingomonas crusticola]|uniref:SirB1 family protein n=1 Tax=Sphingomonas crusticola TaxID=1697973 RepID=UPI000E277E69|nr:transglutaminase-like domain-containing protein [Sphingomonas crusticola]
MADDISYLGLLDDEAIMPDAAALELARLDHAGTDLNPYLQLLNSLTNRLAILAEGAETAEAQAHVLARVMAAEYGFHGDREQYDDPANADMIRVIDRRRGLPVSLSILYVGAARRVGWTADPLNTPGHVLVRLGPTTAPTLIDPFNNGAILGGQELAQLLSGILGREVQPLAEHLAPMTNRAALVRLLMNQAGRAEASGDTARTLSLLQRITAIDPTGAHGWWARARLELTRGDVTAARASLSAILEVTRDPTMREHVAAALDGLAGHTTG